MHCLCIYFILFFSYFSTNLSKFLSLLSFSVIENLLVDVLLNYKYYVKLALDGEGKLGCLTGDIPQLESIWSVKRLRIMVLIEKEKKS